MCAGGRRPPNAVDHELAQLQEDYDGIMRQANADRLRYDQIEAALSTTRDDGPWLN